MLLLNKIISNEKYKSQVIIWLYSCLFMVAIMVLIGGLTRLTNSGLSIVEWKPISGIIPPLNETDWSSEFSKYQTSPEFQKINKDMSVQEFKFIFWLEFIHRLLGRIAGVIFLLPFIYFYFNNTFTSKANKFLLTTFLIGSIQGFIGWYMVKSGLIDIPHVSQYRLALHLSTALIIFSLFLWVLLSIYNPIANLTLIQKNTVVLSIWAFLQIVTGAFVAGLDAGLIYNTFPLMADKFIPTDVAFYNPWWINLFENPATVQFIHRVSSYGLFLYTLYLLVKFRKHDNKLYGLLQTFMVVLIIQMSLGVLTLIYMVPVSFASLHQMNAMLLLSVAVIILHRSFLIKKIA